MVLGPIWTSETPTTLGKVSKINTTVFPETLCSPRPVLPQQPGLYVCTSTAKSSSESCSFFFFSLLLDVLNPLAAGQPESASTLPRIPSLCLILCTWLNGAGCLRTSFGLGHAQESRTSSRQQSSPKHVSPRLAPHPIPLLGTSVGVGGSKSKLSCCCHLSGVTVMV